MVIRLSSYRAAKKAARPANAAGATTAPAAEELELDDELLDEVAVDEPVVLEVEVAVETAVPSLEMVLVPVDSPVAVESEEPVEPAVAELSVLVVAALVTVGTEGPHWDANEDCRPSRADLALASSMEFSEMRALPLRVDWAAASSEASWVCTLMYAVCRAEYADE